MSIAVTPVEEVFNENAAELYDLMYLDGLEFTSQTNELIIGHLRNAGAKRVLDMSCGTGAQAIALCREGFDVLASDLSEAMLTRARNKAKSHDINIEFFQADMTTVSVQPVDAVISIFNSVGFLSKSQFADMLSSAYGNLNEGGVLIFDTFRWQALEKIPLRPFPDFEHNDGKREISRNSTFHYDKDEGYCTIEREITFKENNETRVVKEFPRFAVYLEDEIYTLATKAGFSEVSIIEESMLDLPMVKSSMNLMVLKK